MACNITPPDDPTAAAPSLQPHPSCPGEEDDPTAAAPSLQPHPSCPGEEESEPEADLRVVLVGQERVGKSSAGNTILGKRAFDCHVSSIPVTLSSQRMDGEVLRRIVSVVDTPGLCCSRLSEEKIKEELEEAVKQSSPGPHVFLLVLQLGRFSTQEQEGPKILRKILGPEVLKHTLILFTYGDRLKDTDINLDQFVREDQNLQKLLKSCSGMYHVFNNNEMENRKQVQELLDKIDQVSGGGRKHYEKGSQSDETWFGNIWSLIQSTLSNIPPFNYFVNFDRPASPLHNLRLRF